MHPHEGGPHLGRKLRGVVDRLRHGHGHGHEGADTGSPGRVTVSPVATTDDSLLLQKGDFPAPAPKAAGAAPSATAQPPVREAAGPTAAPGTPQRGPALPTRAVRAMEVQAPSSPAAATAGLAGGAEEVEGFSTAAHKDAQELEERALGEVPYVPLVEAEGMEEAVPATGRLSPRPSPAAAETGLAAAGAAPAPPRRVSAEAYSEPTGPFAGVEPEFEEPEHPAIDRPVSIDRRTESHNVDVQELAPLLPGQRVEGLSDQGALLAGAAVEAPQREEDVGAAAGLLPAVPELADRGPADAEVAAPEAAAPEVEELAAANVGKAELEQPATPVMAGEEAAAAAEEEKEGRQEEAAAAAEEGKEGRQEERALEEAPAQLGAPELAPISTADAGQAAPASTGKPARRALSAGPSGELLKEPPPSPRSAAGGISPAAAESEEGVVPPAGIHNVGFSLPDRASRVWQATKEWAAANPLGAVAVLAAVYPGAILLSSLLTLVFGDFAPLLMVSFTVAALATGAAWLKSRGGAFGGGPHLEMHLLRRPSTDESFPLPTEPREAGQYLPPSPESTEDLVQSGHGLLGTARDTISGVVEEVLEALEPGREQVGDVIQETESGRDLNAMASDPEGEVKPAKPSAPPGVPGKTPPSEQPVSGEGSGYESDSDLPGPVLAGVHAA